MILEDAIWKWSLNQKNALKSPDTCGKWLVIGSLKRISSLFAKIKPLVEGGRIYKAKYTHKKDKDAVFYSKKPVLFVYADDDSKEETARILQELGIKRMEWKYEWQTRQDWQPGGKLYNEYMLGLYMKESQKWGK